MGGDAVEVALEAGRRDDEQRACGLAAQVGVGVRDAARGEGELAGTAGEDDVVELEGELAFEQVEGLVEVVPVKRRPSSSGASVVRPGPRLGKNVIVPLARGPFLKVTVPSTGTRPGSGLPLRRRRKSG